MASMTLSILVLLVVEVIMSGGFSQWVEQDVSPVRGKCIRYNTVHYPDPFNYLDNWVLPVLD